MKKLLLIILFASISIGLKAQCSGITATGILKARAYKSCYDTVMVTSYLNTVIMDTATATKLTTTSSILGTASTTTLNFNSNISSTNWTTSGVRLKLSPIRITNTTSSGTVTAAYSNVVGGDTLASSSSTTYTTYYGTFFKPQIAGPNTTITGNRAVGLSGDMEFTGGRIRFMSGATGGIGTADANQFTVRTSNTDRINILSGGQVGIGITAPTPTSDLHVGGSFSLPGVAKTGTYTISATDNKINCTSGTFTVTLPTAVGISGREYTISNSGAGTITLGTTSSQTINGSTTQSIAAGGGYSVSSDGANWFCIGKW